MQDYGTVVDEMKHMKHTDTVKKRVSLQEPQHKPMSSVEVSPSVCCCDNGRLS